MRHIKTKNITILKNKGFGLVEVLVAVGLLAIVAFGISMSLNNSNKTSQLLTDKSLRSGALREAFDRLESLGVRDRIVPVSDYIGIDLASSSGMATLNAAHTLDLLCNKATSVCLPTFTDNIISYGVSGELITNNAQFILGAQTVAQSFYNSDPPGVCGSARGIDATNYFYAPAAKPQNVRAVYLKVQPFNLLTNRPEPCGASGTKKFSAPSRGVKPVAGFGNPANLLASDGFLIKPDPDLGWMVTITLETLDPASGQVVFTPSQGIYHHQLDQWRPSSGRVGTIVNGKGTVLFNSALNPPTTVQSTSCNNAAGPGNYNDISLTWSIQNIEPGSLLVCQSSTTNGNGSAPEVSPWLPCGRVYFIVGAAQYFVGGATYVGNQLTLNFTTLPPDIEYSLSVRAIDSAGNFSSNSSKALFNIDATRPTVDSITETSGNLGPPGDGNALRQPFPGWLPNNALDKWTYGGNPEGKIQCNTLAPRFSVSYAGTLKTNLVSCDITATTRPGMIACWNPNSQTCEVQDPGGVPAGNHSFTVAAKDICGVGLTASYSWDTVLAMTATGYTGAVYNAGQEKIKPNNRYPVSVNTVGGSPQHFISICDDNATNWALVTENNTTCGWVTRTTMCGSGGCRGPGALKFQGTLLDICGRAPIGGNPKTANYSVRGDLGDPCGQIECGLTGGGAPLICPVNNGAGPAPGMCVLRSSYPTALGSDTAVTCGQTPYQLAGVDGVRNAYSCNQIAATVCTVDPGQTGGCPTTACSIPNPPGPDLVGTYAGANTFQCDPVSAGPAGGTLNDEPYFRSAAAFAGGPPPSPTPPLQMCGQVSIQNVQVACQGQPLSSTTYSPGVNGDPNCTLQIQVKNGFSVSDFNLPDAPVTRTTAGDVATYTWTFPTGGVPGPNALYDSAKWGFSSNPACPGGANTSSDTWYSDCGNGTCTLVHPANPPNTCP